MHQAKYNPICFTGEARFDKPEEIIYSGIDEYTAFRETIGRFSKYRLISSEEIEKRHNYFSP